MAITHISQLDLNGVYTFADYMSWQIQERLELLRGKIALMSPVPNVYHQKFDKDAPTESALCTRGVY
ncbi:MAG: hypothetical protein AAFV78_18745 [Bacteroidota bacterium]